MSKRPEFDVVLKFDALCQAFLTDFDGGEAWQDAKAAKHGGRSRGLQAASGVGLTTVSGFPRQICTDASGQMNVRKWISP
jgi:hypothetical protein